DESGRRPGGPCRDLGHLLPRRPDVRRRQQRVGGRQRRGVRGDRRAARRRRDPRGGGRAPGRGHPVHPRSRRPREDGAGAARGDRRPRPAPPRRQAAVGADTPGHDVGRRAGRRPGAGGGRPPADGPAHARPRPRGCLLLLPRPAVRLHRGHPLPRWPRRHRPLLQRPPHAGGLHPGQAHGAPAGDRRPHRPRRGHHDRRRGRQPRL
ncbi:MAG: Putative hydrolase in cluster with formaldehyde/S-nitrosomycothiol reductase MscR, partial [uncultured Nocardioidaceae bacterium]